jgi:hypothetical protein
MTSAATSARFSPSTRASRCDCDTPSRVEAEGCALNRPATPKDDGPAPAPGVLRHDTVILVVAVHLLGLVGGLSQRGGELECLLDRERNRVT